MAHETDGSGIRDRRVREDERYEHDRYGDQGDHGPASGEMPERHGAPRRPQSSHDEERERAMREGYR